MEEGKAHAYYTAMQAAGAGAATAKQGLGYSSGPPRCARGEAACALLLARLSQQQPCLPFSAVACPGWLLS